MKELLKALQNEEFKCTFLNLPKYCTKNNLTNYQSNILEKYLGVNFIKIINTL